MDPGCNPLNEEMVPPMDVHADAPDPSDSDADPETDGAGSGHLACAYSPRWLSGPSHYEGLVATFTTDHDDHRARQV